MKRRTKSTNSKQTALILGIAITSFTVGGIATHMIHSTGAGENSAVEETLTNDERLSIQEYKAESEKAKEANLLALEAEDKWYEEVTKTQKARAAAKEAKKKSLERVAALEAAKLELIELQNLARIEKQVAAEAVVRATRAKSQAEDHELYSYEKTQEAKQNLKKAQVDQEKADSLLDKFAKLETDIQAPKISYAILEAKYEVILKENNRLARKPPVVKREVVVVNTNTTEYVHIPHNRTTDTSRQPYCPPTKPSRQYTPSRPVTCPPAQPTPRKKYSRYR